MTPEQAIERLKGSTQFSDWVGRLDAIVSPAIADYRASGYALRESKAIKDSLWGMIPADASEVYVINSPPLQRLRRIRQLGVSSVTYPSASYSRFEHALGAMHQSDRMLTAVTLRSDGALRSRLEGARPLVRLAALVHDVGHLPLSHVAERYYSEAECGDKQLLDNTRAISSEVAATLGVRVNVAEILSVVMLCTPSMWSLLTAGAGYSNETVAAAACSIVARPASPGLAFVSQMISNAVDADKLDYLFRDSTVTRIPLAVDLDRLLYKLKAREVPPRRAGVLVSKISQPNEQAVVLVTDLSGNQLAYDLLAARSMLFERIYLHHKTRAAERVVLEMLRQINLHPIDLLAHDDGLLSRYGAAERSDDFKALATRIESRSLPNRAFAISYDFLVESAPASESGKLRVGDDERRGWKELERDLKDFTARESLRDEIQKEADRIASALSTSSRVVKAANRLWLEPTPKPYKVSDARLLVERPDGTVELADAYPPHAYGFTRAPHAVAFVFADGDDEQLVISNMAAEAVLAARYRLRFARRAADLAKVDVSEVEERKRDLERRNPDWYSTDGRVRPRSHLVASDHGQERIEAMVAKWQTYNVPRSDVTSTSVSAFLDQFPEDLVAPMLDVLDAATFLTREQLVSNIVSAVGDQEGHIVQLTTDSRKSAGTLPYQLRDHYELTSVDDALKEAGAPVTFVDDVLVSGKQARTVVQVWLGLDPDLPDEVDLTSRLNSEAEAALRDGRIVRFRFAYAHRDGIEALMRLLREAGLPEDIEAAFVEEGDPLPASAAAQSDDLETFLKEVGFALLQSTKSAIDPTKWNEERCRRHAYGYGNRGLLVVPYYNCPTGTVTALWSDGEFRNTPWRPLFRRHQKAQETDSPGATGDDSGSGPAPA